MEPRVDDQEYSIWHHLAELRKHLFRAAIGVVLVTFGCFYVSNEILAWLRAPMEAVLGEQAEFVVLAPQEYFFTQMKAALVGGIFVASPWILYQAWLFIAPGLYKNERKYVVAFVFFGAFFFVAGAIFSYEFVFPPMFEFFIGTLPPDVKGQYSIGMLMGFATNMLLAFGAVFEAPVVVYLLCALGVVDPVTLGKYRRYVIVIAFIIAAVLTPTPDPMTQTMMATPMIILFELGLLAARLTLPKRDTSPEAVQKSVEDAVAKVNDATRSENPTE